MKNSKRNKCKENVIKNIYQKWKRNSNNNRFTTIKKSHCKINDIDRRTTGKCWLNHDGKITATDLLKLKRMIVKLDN